MPEKAELSQPSGMRHPNYKELLLADMLGNNINRSRVYNLAWYIPHHYSLMVPSFEADILSDPLQPQQCVIGDIGEPTSALESLTSDYRSDDADDIMIKSILTKKETSDNIFDISDDIASGLLDFNSSELWKAVRKLSDKKVKLVLKTVYDNQAMTFGELLKATALSVNDLNHVLGNLRQSNLVIRSADKKYYLTKYCIALLDALGTLKAKLSELKPNEFRSPAQGKKLLSTK